MWLKRGSPMRPRFVFRDNLHLSMGLELSPKHAGSTLKSRKERPATSLVCVVEDAAQLSDSVRDVFPSLKWVCTPILAVIEELRDPVGCISDEVG
jgi:hypothetical protein